MAYQEQLDILKQGVEIWNEWREKNPDILIDLTSTDLTNANLTGADLTHAEVQITQEGDITRYTLPSGLVFIMKDTLLYAEGEPGYGVPMKQGIE